MRIELVAIAVATYLVVACTTTTGVVPLGEDTFMIGTSGKSPGGFSGAQAKANALQEAQKFCAAQGKKVQVVNTQQADMRFGVDATAEVQFMCLSPGDAELGRPKLRKTPDQLIEVVSPAAPPVAAPPQKRTDLYSDMLKLEDLKKRGLLTDAEFEDQRRKLLIQE